MTGNDDRNRIAIVRHAHRAECVRMRNRLSDGPVAASFAVRDVEEGAPAFQLKIGPAQIQRKRETFAMAGEVFVELTDPGIECGGGFLPILTVAAGRLVAVEFQSHQAVRGKSEEQWAGG